MDWETKVVRRVERHLESLFPESHAQVGPLQQLGWEEASLVTLKHRIEELKSG